MFNYYVSNSFSVFEQTFTASIIVSYLIGLIGLSAATIAGHNTSIFNKRALHSSRLLLQALHHQVEYGSWISYLIIWICCLANVHIFQPKWRQRFFLQWNQSEQIYWQPTEQKNCDCNNRTHTTQWLMVRHIICSDI